MSKNEIVQFAPPQVPSYSVSDIRTIGESIAKSGLFGIKTVDQAVALCLLAQAEGRHPATVARDYHIISGSPAKKAEAMQRDFLMAGGKIEWHELTDAAVEATFSHPLGGTARIRWDAARVAQAQLGGNQMHKKYPRQMLRSRVVSEGVRTVWPLATSGMYEPGEVADFEPQQREPIDVTPKDDLDAFASGSAIDADTGEIIDPPDLEGEARAVAAKGWTALKAFADTLSDDGYEQLRPLLGTRDNPGELRLIARQADDVAQSHSPAGTVHPMKAQHSAASPAGETDTPAGNGYRAKQSRNARKDASLPDGGSAAPAPAPTPAGDTISDMFTGEPRSPSSLHVDLQDETSEGWEGWRLAMWALIEAKEPPNAILAENRENLVIFEQIDQEEHGKIMRALEAKFPPSPPPDTGGLVKKGL